MRRFGFSGSNGWRPQPQAVRYRGMCHRVPTEPVWVLQKDLLRSELPAL